MLQSDYTKKTESDVITENIQIPASAGMLEAKLVYQENVTFCDGVILLPPHPNFAGTLDNNIIKALLDNFGKAGFATLSFNYPGIGNSEFNVDTSLSPFDYWAKTEAEQQFEAAMSPARSAVTYFQNTLQPFLNRIHLVGYSYGGIIAMMLAGELNIFNSVSAISMPWIKRYDYDFLAKLNCQKYFITAKADFVYEPDVQARVWQTLPEPKRFDIVEGDHFFRGEELSIAKKIRHFILRTERFYK